MQLLLPHLKKLLHPGTTFVLGMLVLSLPNLSLAYTEPVALVYRLVNLLLPLSLYAAALSWWYRPGRMLWVLFPLVFLSAFQMVLIYLYGHSVIAVDMFLNLLTTNPGEAGELLDNLLPGIVFVVVLYVPTLVLAALSGWRGKPLGSQTTRRIRRTAGVGATVGLLLLLFLTGKDYRIANDLYPVNVFQNIRLAALRTQATARYGETSAAFRFGARSDSPKDEREVYLLVVGETARAPQFQLYGYGRKTNPELSMRKDLFAFDKALTQSNTTHKSVPMLLSGISAANYDSIYTQKSLIEAFREAGFHTVFLSNQLPNHSFIDFFGQEADEWCFIRMPQPAGRPPLGRGYDEDLLPLVDRVLQKKRRKELIVLHTYGSHFEYRQRYPHSLAHFQPDDASEATPGNRASLLNAYDNTIRATDQLLSRLIARLEAENTVSALLYTSDHGENLFDDDRHLFLHASPIPSCFELHVPLLVWLSPRYRSQRETVVKALSANLHRPVATSLSVFHTFLHLARLRTPRLRLHHSVASALYRPTPLLYLNDHNEPIPLRQMLKDNRDRLYLQQIGVEKEAGR